MSTEPSREELDIEWDGGVHTEKAFMSPPAIAALVSSNPKTVACLILALAHSINNGVGGNAEECRETLQKLINARRGKPYAHRDRRVLWDLCRDITSAVEGI